MPELPEVNTFKQYFDGTSLKKRIMNVNVHDAKIIRNVSGDEFIDHITGRTFTGSTRRGKYLFGHLDDGNHLLLHFGMTGDLKYYSDISERPKHERFSFDFDNGDALGFDCPRKFARIVYITDLDQYIADVGLGADALDILEEDFLAFAKGRKMTIKGFLLNQKILAGVGNLYADEICYQTKVTPNSVTGKIPKRKLKEIFIAMKNILHTAIESAAHYKDYPDDWFWKWRKKDGQSDKGEIIITKVAGRTTYHVKGWQKKY